MEVMNILLVDDKRENLLALESLLRSEAVAFHRAASGVQALELLLYNEFALALIDVQMPEMDGFELAELMRGTEQTRSVPIIFVTAGAHDRLNLFKGYERGAVDFLYKPLDPHIVKSKVQIFLDLARQRQLLKLQLQETQRALGQRDEALATAREALRARDEFMSIASHELKTPLTSLFLQLQMVGRAAKKSITALSGATLPEATSALMPVQMLERIVSAMQVCERQSAKLSSLIDELLDLTRVRLGKLELMKERTNLTSLTQEVLVRFRAETDQKKIEISLEASQEIWGEWDPARIDQIMTNLVSNAIKYGGGKPVRIRLEEGSEPGPGPRRARLIVQDQGLGIPPNLQDKIFERFERAMTGEKISGLGLGLYIVRQIVEAHGGSVRVRSALNVGSTFVVELPVSQAAQNAAPKAQSEAG